eukprot:m51a1_g11324 hypothetical protein (567) ;mRNA; f:123144-125467
MAAPTRHSDPVNGMRVEIRALERDIQRAVERREALRMQAQLQAKKDEFRKLAEVEAAASPRPKEGKKDGGGQTAPQVPQRESSGSTPTDHAKSVLTTVSGLAHLRDSIPSLPVAVPAADGPTATLTGPADEELQSWFDQIAARTVSSYPMLNTGKKLGSPIADNFHIEVSGGRFLLCLADGCSWGERAQAASKKASHGFTSHLLQNHSKLRVIREAGQLLLEAFSLAHSDILTGKELWECGTTTILGGMLLPVQGKLRKSRPDKATCRRSASSHSLRSMAMVVNSANKKPAEPSPLAQGEALGTSAPPGSAVSQAIASAVLKEESRQQQQQQQPKEKEAGKEDEQQPNPTDPDTWEWAFVFLSCGDCKAFHWNAKTHRVTDITAGNRLNVTDPTDPGGRIGPQMDNGMPDLRNLRSYSHPCFRGDLLLVCSDGVHDNLDPPSLGIDPGELCDDFRGMTWDAAAEHNRELVDEIRQSFMEARLEVIIADIFRRRSADMGDKPISPASVTNAVVEYCLRVTSAARSYMEENPAKNQPKDMKEYPGKMDHTTCITIRVDHPADYVDFLS